MRSSLTGRAEPAALVVLVFMVPVGTLLAEAAANPRGELLVHLFATVVPMQAGYGALAALGAALLGALLAVGGLLGALFEFRGRRLLHRLLLAPLLVPAWFLAVMYRETWRVNGVLPLLMVLGAASAPLFHLFGTAALRTLPRQYLDTLRVSGRGHPPAMACLLLPFALPALGAAAALAVLLAWADAASARALSVPTLAVGMLDQWAAREEASAGALLGLLVAAFSLLAAGALLWLLGRTSYQDDAGLPAVPAPRVRLGGAWALVPWLLAAPQLVLGVVLPARAIGTWSAEKLERVNLTFLGEDALGTLLVAGAGTLLAAALALPLAHARSFAGTARWTNALFALAVAPFALPSAVLAASMLWGLRDDGPLAFLNATVFPLVGAFGVRHSAVFAGAAHAALQRHARDHLAVMRVLGRAGLGWFVVLLRPFLARPMAAAAAFVFLACLGEVHLSTVLSPFGFHTLSARVLQLAQAERTQECAVYMLCLALIGVFPLVTLARLADAEAGPKTGE